MSNRIAGIQMTSQDDVTYNLALAKKLMLEALDAGAKMIVLPENFSFMGADPKPSEMLSTGPVQHFLQTLAREHRVWIVGGTIPIKHPNHPHKVFAASLVFDDRGQMVGHYYKMHLFDVELPSEKYEESARVVPGEEPKIIKTPFGWCGLAICYDIRFPELFRYVQMQGAEMVTLPSAFTVPTGKAHWEILVRARAIENQVYVIAAAQTGRHPNKRETYGHSLIVNPWGEVLASLGDEEGIVVADVDLAYLHQLRERFPVLKHKRNF